MHFERGSPARRLSRRALIATASALAAGAASRPRAGAKQDDPSAQVIDVCYWEPQQTICSGGRKLQRRCEICCAGGSCETVRCLWFDIGPC
jgi:hypothetical protein